MIRVSNIKVKLDENIKEAIIHNLKAKKEDIVSFKINKKSIDARDKENIHYVYEIDVNIKNESKYLKRKNVIKTPKEVYSFKSTGKKNLNNRPVIIGSGPAGLFCGYILAYYGYKPVIIERGEKVENRDKTVNTFWNKNILNENSNVQFGEGGAGLFSDGKLNTLVKDKNFRMKKVFEIFVELGAPKEILYENKPHIGTDVLKKVIKNMREKIIKMGGEFKYDYLMSDINVEKDKIKSIIVNNETIDTDVLVLAIGHSARDTFKMLYDKNFNMEAKSFAIGVRVMHQQSFINNAQYGKVLLPPASYKLTFNTNKRGIYTFCMCPGGFIVNASSEKGRLVINGMSNYKRDSGIANSAVIVTVTKDDFGIHPLDGIKYQQALEEKAYNLENGKIPVQTFKDFKENKISTEIHFDLKIKGEYKLSNIREIYPDYIADALIEAIEYFDTKIKGFKNTVLAGIETRTSSPVRIVRDEYYESNIKGVYPCGEGAGYAGGITTSAIDGIKVAEAIMTKYKPF